MEKRLYRNEQHKVIAGVCAGLAEYLDINVTVIRILFFLTLVLKGGGGVLYIILWIALPKKLYYFTDPQVDHTMRSQSAGAPFDSASPGQPQAPFVMPAKRRSPVSIVFGIVLVLLGTFFLLNEFDVLPDFDIGRLWPLIFVIAGAVILFTGNKRDPWEKEDQDIAGKKEDIPKNDETLNNPPPVEYQPKRGDV
jgi:phage shock protein C